MTEPSVVAVQHQIRSNASQLQDYFSDLYAWEKSIDKEDSARKRAARTTKSLDATPPPRTATVVGVGNNSESSGEGDATDGKQPGAHTYDKGYKRWEKFDVDAALREADGGGSAVPIVEDSPASSVPRRVVVMAQSAASSATTKSREELEKEEGNAHYKRGDYVAAVKSYTRCLGYNPQNAVVLSNRAMAYLKNREFANAEDDCTLALKANPTHVKSFSRRGTARNSLGKHRLALLDFHRAAMLDPKSRQIQTQLQSTRDLIRTAIKRSPKRTQFSIEVVGESSLVKPEVGSEALEDKENLGSHQQVNLSADFTDTKQQPSPLQESGLASASPPSSTTTSVQTTPESKKKRMLAILPKLPKKAPATSYEFGRVWKTLALRGDAEHKIRLLSLRADYLRMINPTTLRSVFKTGMESDVLCEIFQVLRYAVLALSDADSAVSNDSFSFALAHASELAKVTRFNMTVMLLSDSEKEDMIWVISNLQEQVKDGDEAQQREVDDLMKLYELP
ncbi:hypothetical protein KRP22_000066 [Phytophthora ramorum]|nr:RNA polymerase II-associated protein 3 [Phytophthora ramorum]